MYREYRNIYIYMYIYIYIIYHNLSLAVNSYPAGSSKGLKWPNQTQLDPTWPAPGQLRPRPAQTQAYLGPDQHRPRPPWTQVSHTQANLGPT